MAENMAENAQEIFNFFRNKGWTAQSICGMLGNMQAESVIIADCYQGNGGGYGLVQWDPMSNLTSWANARGLDYRTVNTQCQRIQYELENGLQYFIPQGGTYQLTFHQFTQSTQSPSYLASAFLYNYERAGFLNEANRRAWAESWFTNLNVTQDDFNAMAEGYFNALSARTDVSSWAINAWNNCVSRGLLDGTSPKGILPREQFAAVLNKIV